MTGSGRNRPDQGWFTPPEQHRPFGQPPPEPSRPDRPGQHGPGRPHEMRPEASGAGAPPGARAAPWQRLVARLIDGIIVAILAVLVALPLWTDYISHTLDLVNAAKSSGAPLSIDATTTRLAVLCGAVLDVVYFVYEFVQVGRWGHTIGKWALGIGVVDERTGHRPGWNVAAARAAVFTLPPIVPTVGLLFLLLNVSWQLWDSPKRQCLHDKAAHTIVVTR